MSLYCFIYIYIFLAFDFVGSGWSFGFFIPATTANDLRLRRISILLYTSYPLHYFLILILVSLYVFCTQTTLLDRNHGSDTICKINVYPNSIRLTITSNRTMYWYVWCDYKLNVLVQSIPCERHQNMAHKLAQLSILFSA